MYSNRKKKEHQAQLITIWVEKLALKKRNDNLEEVTRQIVKAIEDKGKVPKYHDHVMRKHRDEWPALWQALDNLVSMYQDYDKRN